jgi:hypothetical protein
MTELQALVIASRDRPDLAESLGCYADGIRTVILDRRQGERRCCADPPGLERPAGLGGSR